MNSGGPLDDHDADDPQRDRVYAAENDCRYAWGRRFISLDDVREWLGDVFESRWFTGRYRSPGCDLLVTDFVVQDDLGDGWAWGRLDRRTAHIVLPAGLRYELIVLHELAHCLTRNADQLHGREFCSLYLQLVRRFMGADQAGWLRESFVTHCVRHRRFRGNSRATTKWLWPGESLFPG